jgi:hypothetical protein
MIEFIKSIFSSKDNKKKGVEEESDKVRYINIF